MTRFTGALSVVFCLAISSSIHAADITNISVTSGEFSGMGGGGFPFISSGPEAFTSFGGYNLIDDFPTPVGWDPGVIQTTTQASAVVAFINTSGPSNFFLANSHVLDPGGLTYNSTSGTVNGSQNTYANGDVIEIDMDGLFLNWNGNVFNVGGVATGVVSNVSGNNFDYTASWTGTVTSSPFPGQEYNITFSGTGTASQSLFEAAITNLSATSGEFSGQGGGAFPFVSSGPEAFTSFGSYNLVTDFPTPIAWDPAVAQATTQASAVVAFVGTGGASNFFMANSHILDPSGLTYNSASGTVDGISNGSTIEFDMDGLFLNWNTNVFNVGGIATGTISNASGNTFDYTISWTGIVNSGPFTGQEYNLIFNGSGEIDAPPDGDLNLDGVVDTTDIVLARRASLGDYVLTPLQMLHADVAPLVAGTPAPDGIFDAADALLITKKANGLISF